MRSFESVHKRYAKRIKDANHGMNDRLLEHYLGTADSCISFTKVDNSLCLVVRYNFSFIFRFVRALLVLTISNVHFEVLSAMSMWFGGASSIHSVAIQPVLVILHDGKLHFICKPVIKSAFVYHDLLYTHSTHHIKYVSHKLLKFPQ